MLERLNEIEREALLALEQASDEAALGAWKSAFLGRSAELGRITEGLRELSKEERPAVGRRANDVKKALEAAYESRQAALKSKVLQHTLGTERLDVTLPGRPVRRGRLHPATQMLREIPRDKAIGGNFSDSNENTIGLEYSSVFCDR